MISATIIADSINEAGKRLTTFVVTYPRFIHSELMTHRAFSRNAASSRAIPIESMISAVAANPAWPEKWGSNKPGMQAGADLFAEDRIDCKAALERLAGQAIEAVHLVSGLGLHKQNANRYLEPWGHITVIVTSADWALMNFFALRAHKDAQPEFQVLAFRMLALYVASEPKLTPWGCWHVPWSEFPIEILPDESNMSVIRAAVGQCARVSYLRQDSDDQATNIQIHDRLEISGHWSPFEHVARAKPGLHSISNFDRVEISEGPTGIGIGGLSHWEQYRKQFPEECKTADLHALLAAKPDWVTL